MEAHPARTFSFGGAEARAGAMLVACRLAGLSALILDYAAKVARAQFGPTQSPIGLSRRHARQRKALRRTAGRVSSNTPPAPRDPLSRLGAGRRSRLLRCWEPFVPGDDLSRFGERDLSDCAAFQRGHRRPGVALGLALADTPLMRDAAGWRLLAAPCGLTASRRTEPAGRAARLDLLAARPADGCDLGSGPRSGDRFRPRGTRPSGVSTRYANAGRKHLIPPPHWRIALA